MIDVVEMAARFNAERESISNPLEGLKASLEDVSWPPDYARKVTGVGRG